MKERLFNEIEWKRDNFNPKREKTKYFDDDSQFESLNLVPLKFLSNVNIECDVKNYVEMNFVIYNRKCL